jgi:hypothetical protein
MSFAHTIAKMLYQKMSLATFFHRVSTLTMVDVGSGNGKLALEIARLIEAKRLILIDKKNKLEVPLPPHAKFFQMDIYSDEFLYCIPQADVMTCIRTFHEFPDPCSAAMRFISKTHGVLIIRDWMEKGWERILKEDQQIRDEKKRKEELAHDEEDLQLVRKNRLYTPEEIRRFWKIIDQNVPGLMEFHFGIETYVVVYCGWIKIEKVNLNQISTFDFFESARK